VGAIVSRLAAFVCPSFEFSTKPQTIPQIGSTPARLPRVLIFRILEEWLTRIFFFDG
jgi:hypothetical protein